MNNEERARVGLCYKQEGSEAAIALGHALVSGAIKKRRVEAWQAFLTQSPNPILLCARGGLRSRISQEWLHTVGVPVRRVRGGYKALRGFLLDQLEELTMSSRLLVLSGYTGSGKTAVLHRLRAQGVAIIDLEGLANHRGSAFGKLGDQPEQATFENRLAIELLKVQKAPFVVIESESRSIGRNWLPNTLLENMRSSAVVVLDCSFDRRVQTIIDDYVIGLENTLKNAGVSDPQAELSKQLLTSIACLKKRLGGKRHKEIEQQLSDALSKYCRGADSSVHQQWVAPLLSDYYDRFYERHLVQQEVRTIARANEDYLVDFLVEANKAKSLGTVSSKITPIGPTPIEATHTKTTPNKETPIERTPIERTPIKRTQSQASNQQLHAR